MTETETEQKPPKIWLNALSCVRPSDEFAAQVGRALIQQLMRDGQPKVEDFDPYRRLVVELVCS